MVRGSFFLQSVERCITSQSAGDKEVILSVQAYFRHHYQSPNSFPLKPFPAKSEGICSTCRQKECKSRRMGGSLGNAVICDMADAAMNS